MLAAFNQEKALVGAFSVITNLRMELIEALVLTHKRWIWLWLDFNPSISSSDCLDTGEVAG